MWAQHFSIELHGVELGIRTDSTDTAERVLDTHKWSVASSQPRRVDLSIDLADAANERNPHRTLRHGERVVVRSRNVHRILTAAGRWARELTMPQLTVAHAPGMNGAVLDGEVLLTPRWLTADVALMDRLMPDTASWLDSRWVEFAASTGPDSVIVADTPLPIRGIALDTAHRDVDLSTPARRAAAILTQLAGDGALDTAIALSSLPIVSVDTKDARAACKAAVSLVS